MKKLELKDLCGYLPYGLKVQGQTHKDIFELGGMDGDVVLLVGNGRVDLFDIKPLLIPLLALTEQMEDGSVPIVELAKKCYSKLNWDVTIEDAKCYIGSKFNPKQYIFWYSIYENSFYCISTCRSEPKAAPYQLQLFEYLFAHHFDIYDLIGQGLAIDKRTIELKKK